MVILEVSVAAAMQWLNPGYTCQAAHVHDTSGRSRKGREGLGGVCSAWAGRDGRGCSRTVVAESSSQNSSTC